MQTARARLDTNSRPPAPIVCRVTSLVSRVRSSSRSREQRDSYPLAFSDQRDEALPLSRQPQIQDQESKRDTRAQRRRQLPTFYPELIIKARRLWPALKFRLHANDGACVRHHMISSCSRLVISPRSRMLATRSWRRRATTHMPIWSIKPSRSGHPGHRASGQ